MKEGFYYINTTNWVRCYYLTGEKKGNKWISIFEFEPIPNPEWWALNWMNLPNKEELTGYEYFKDNPTDYPVTWKIS